METSSITGLSYIKTYKSICSRIYWIIIVFTSISFSIFFINDSLNDWAEQPVKSSTEVLPISGVKLPGITVCPPKGSNSALNYDLIRARNITLDNTYRQEILRKMQDPIIEEKLKEELSWRKLMHNLTIDARTWLEGYSHLSSSTEICKSYTYHNFDGYKWWTGNSSGSLTAPLNEQKDNDVWKSLEDVGYSYDIAIFPKFEDRHEVYFVLKLACYDGPVTIWYLIDNEKVGSTRCYLTAGYRNVKLRKVICKKESCSIIVKLKFQRTKNKIVKGFHAEWNLEHKNGTIIDKFETDLEDMNKRIDLDLEEIVLDRDLYHCAQSIKFNMNMHILNQIFRDFIDMVNKVISLKVMSVNDIEEESRHLWYEFIINERENMDEHCEEGSLKTAVLDQLLYNISSKFLNKKDIERTFTKTFNNCCFKNLSSEISDEVLIFGYDLFLNISTCIRISEDIYENYEFFSNASPRTLMQEIFQLNNAVKSRDYSRMKEDHIKLLYPVSSFLVNKLQLEYQIIDAISNYDAIINIKNGDDNTELGGNIKNPIFKSIIDDCILHQDCTALKSKMAITGK